MDSVIGLLYEAKDKLEKGEVVNTDLLQFLGFCFKHIRDTKSQNFQDIWAMYECGDISSAHQNTYVEFGGTNGIDGSNTYILERIHLWQGMVAEPNPIYHNDLETNRLCKIDKRVVWNKSGEKIDFMLTPASDLSTIVGYENKDYNAERRIGGKTIQVETVTLYDMLEQNGLPENISYISVDTEGTEYEILEKFFAQNNNKYNVKCWTIEHNFVEETRERIFDLMAANGYKRKFTSISRWDDFYLKVG